MGLGNVVEQDGVVAAVEGGCRTMVERWFDKSTQGPEDAVAT